MGTAKTRRRGVLAAQSGRLPRVVAAWLGGCSSSSSSSSSERCRLRRHRRPRVPLFLTQIRCNIYTLPHLQKPNLSPFCCMNTPFIPAFSCISSRTELPSSSRSIYLSIYHLLSLLSCFGFLIPEVKSAFWFKSS